MLSSAMKKSKARRLEACTNKKGVFIVECPLCVSRGQDWSGSAPVCGFQDGVFSPANWNCATLNALRKAAVDFGKSYRNDGIGAIGYLPLDTDFATEEESDAQNPGFVVLQWYKERGRTENAVFMADGEISPLTLRQAQLALETYNAYKQVNV